MPTVIAATDAGLFRLGDGDGTELDGRKVADLALGSDGWWAIADSSDVLRRRDEGGWETATSVEGRRLTCLHPTPSALLIGTDRAHLLAARGHSTEPVAAFEDAPGRADWYTPWGGPPAVRSIAGRDSIHVNVHVGGILRSEDGGASWTPTIDIHSDVHEVTLAGDPDTVLAATALGLAISRDGGDSWDFDAQGLHSSYARAVAIAGDQIVMSASVGPFGGDSGIFRRALHQPGFEKVHHGLPEWFPENIDTGCLAARDGVVSFGTADGRVFLSEDHGDSWEQIGHDLPPVNKVVLVGNGL